MSDYAEFLARKAQEGTYAGFAPLWLPDFLFPFQRALVDWAVRKGKAALLVDTGLGKTPMQLVWAQNVVERTNKPVLVMTPLAVARQTVREGAKFGIECDRSKGAINGAKIVATNYEQLHHFDPQDFGGAVCDEASCLKNYDGVRKAQITEFMRVLPYRLLCTATAAPNDYIELGTLSEALGELGYIDMLNRFFKNDRNTTDTKGAWRGFAAPRQWTQPQWRFKGHAEQPFWRWVCSWARAMRRPSDLGFDDGPFILPPLVEQEHIVHARTKPAGMLFELAASNMQEEREERRRTLVERCEMMVERALQHDRSALWCHLNPEGDLIERLLPDCRQIAGSTPDDEKEEIYDAFSIGQLKRVVTKPKIGAWGLNWFHCAHVATFASHSFEQHYQLVRRCWRFGQTRSVHVDLIATEGERGIKENVQRKARAADNLFTALVANMNEAMSIRIRGDYDKPVEIPSWLEFGRTR